MPFSPARLRALREAANMPREQLAIAVGRSYPTIHQYETGGTVPTIDVAERMARALEVPVTDLFDQDAAVAALLAARDEAGLPGTVTDPDALDRIAKVLAASERASTTRKKAS